MPYRLLLDTSSLMYRAFFALPPSIADHAGQPINAVHGYLDMTTRLLSTYKPHELIRVYDADWRMASPGQSSAYWRLCKRSPSHEQLHDPHSCQRPS